ncbi:MAG: hypothetical protein WAW13_00605 [Minisyncoccia bacterium]
MTDNMHIWSQVEKTDPAHTKKVNLGHGFTAINAAYQIKRATETFGPVGEGWGYDAGEPIFHDLMVFVPVTLWHGDRARKFGPMFGGAEWKSQKGRLDSDALKKATTDALTKLLSQLGFNADVFLGLFDDNKYLAEVRAEFAEPKDAPKTPAEPPKPPTLSERADRLVAALKALPTATEREKAYKLASKLLADLDASDPERLAEIEALYLELQFDGERVAA